jgi:hypothetical protein
MEFIDHPAHKGKLIFFQTMGFMGNKLRKILSRFLKYQFTLVEKCT